MVTDNGTAWRIISPQPVNQAEESAWSEFLDGVGTLNRKPSPQAIALQASQEAERLAEWKGTGMVAETARRAAKRAEDEFLRLRMDYHRGNNGVN